jgi:hypothetical protein
VIIWLETVGQEVHTEFWSGNLPEDRLILRLILEDICSEAWRFMGPIAAALNPLVSRRIICIEDRLIARTLPVLDNTRQNKIEKMYSLEYNDIPKVFLTPHHVGNCCTNVIQDHS